LRTITPIDLGSYATRDRRCHRPQPRRRSHDARPPLPRRTRTAWRSGHPSSWAERKANKIC